MNIPLLVPITLSLLTPVTLRATVLEDFSGHRPGDTLSTGQGRDIGCAIDTLLIQP